MAYSTWLMVDNIGITKLQTSQFRVISLEKTTCSDAFPIKNSNFAWFPLNMSISGNPPIFLPLPGLSLVVTSRCGRGVQTPQDIMVVKKVIKLSIFVSNTWRYEDGLNQDLDKHPTLYIFYSYPKRFYFRHGSNHILQKTTQQVVVNFITCTSPTLRSNWAAHPKRRSKLSMFQQSQQSAWHSMDWFKGKFAGKPHI